MTIFLTLSPFAAFGGLMVLGFTTAALFTSLVVSLGLIAADVLRGRSLKLLQVGAAMLFAAMGAYVLTIDRGVSEVALRTALDVGMLGIALGSLAARRPFTIQYARETVDSEVAARPDFHRVNTLLTWVWVAAFAAMLAADLCTMYTSWLPLWAGLAMVLVARNGAVYFTQWYARRRRAMVAAERATSIALAR